MVELDGSRDAPMTPLRDRQIQQRIPDQTRLHISLVAQALMPAASRLIGTLGSRTTIMTILRRTALSLLGAATGCPLRRAAATQIPGIKIAQRPVSAHSRVAAGLYHPAMVPPMQVRHMGHWDRNPRRSRATGTLAGCTTKVPPVYKWHVEHSVIHRRSDTKM